MKRHISLVACGFLALAFPGRAQNSVCAKLASRHFTHTRVTSAKQQIRR